MSASGLLIMSGGSGGGGGGSYLPLAGGTMTGAINNTTSFTGNLGSTTNGLNIKDGTGNLIQAGTYGLGSTYLLLYSTGFVELKDAAGDQLTVNGGSVNFNDVAGDSF